MKDNDKVIQPRVLIIPTAPADLGSVGLISGMVFMSGSNLMMWMGRWSYISGASVAQVFG